MSLLELLSAPVPVCSYLVCFQERQEALKNMQQRVSATEPAWKRVDELLTDEYAKGRK